MSYTVLALDFVCDKTQKDRFPIYRVYIDDVLIVERKFWPDSPLNFIQERFTFEDDDKTHTCRFENVDLELGTVSLQRAKLVDGDSNVELPELENLLVGFIPGSGYKFGFSLAKR